MSHKMGCILLWLIVCRGAPIDAVGPQTPLPPQAGQSVPEIAPSPAMPTSLKRESIDRSIAGITLTVPSDPAFQTFAAALVPADKMAIAAPYLPESVIVTNDSGRALLALSIDFAFPSPGGNLRHNSILISELGLSKPVMAAGERRIIFQGGLLETIIKGRHPPQAPPGIAASIDLAIYANWLVAGPDSRQHLPRLLSAMRAAYDVCSHTGAPGTSGAADLGWLAKEAAKASPGTDGYARELQRDAERMLQGLQHGMNDFVNGYCSQVTTTPAVVAGLFRVVPIDPSSAPPQFQSNSLNGQSSVSYSVRGGGGPSGGAAIPAASGTAHEFTVYDAEMHIQQPRVSINGVRLELPSPSRVANGSLVWFYVPQHGRYVLSLSARAEFGFVKAGEVRGGTVSLEMGGNRVQLESPIAFAPGGAPYVLYALQDADWTPTAEAQRGSLLFGTISPAELAALNRK